MKEYKNRIKPIHSVASTTANLYFCRCGHIGEWKEYYDSSKFVCENCKEKQIFRKVKSRKKTTLKNQFITDVQFELIDNKLYLNSSLKNQLINFEEKKVEYINNDIVYYDYEKGVFSKNINSITYSYCIRKEILNKILENFKNTNVKYKFNIENLNKEYMYNDENLKLEIFSMILQHTNLTFLQEYDLSFLIFVFKNKIFFDFDATNINNFSGYTKKTIIHIFENLQCLHYLNIEESIISYGFNNKLSNEQFINLIDYYIKLKSKVGQIHNVNDFFFIYNNYKNIDKLEDYLNSCEVYQAIQSNIALGILKDYAKMNIDMENKNFDKYPKSLKLKHDISSRNYKFKQDEIKTKKIEKVNEKFKYLEFKNKDYSIIVPKNPDEIIQEGLKLNHCVACYIDSMADEKTLILFMRKNEDIDKNYITIELNPISFKIIQCRGNSNRILNKKEKDFLKEWTKYISKKENKECI